MSVAAVRRVAISLGDPAGIGPEIALKAALDPRVTDACLPLLVGDERALRAHAEACGLAPTIRAYRSAAEVAWRESGVKLLALDALRNEGLALGQIRAAHGRAAIAAAGAAIAAARDGHVEAVVAAPQTEAKLLAKDRAAAMIEAVLRLAGVPRQKAA